MHYDLLHTMIHRRYICKYIIFAVCTQAVHDPDKKEFVIQLKDNKKGDKAFLQYDYITNNKVDLYHTLVPPSYRGHGIAGILAETAFKHFKDNGIEMELTCSYLQHYASKHPPT